MGHFEDAGFVGVNQALIGGNWQQPYEAPMEPEWEEHYEAVVEEREAWPVWTLKDPRLCLMGQRILRFLPRPRIICTVRPEEATASSLSQREGMQMDQAIHLTRLYLKAREWVAGSGRPTLNIGLKWIADDVRRGARELARFAFRGTGVTPDIEAGAAHFSVKHVHHGG